MNHKNNRELDIDLVLLPLEVEDEDVVIDQEAVPSSALLTQWISEIDDESSKEKILIHIDKQNLTTIINLL